MKAHIVTAAASAIAAFVGLIAAAWAWSEAGRVDDMGQWLADYFLIAAILCLPVVAGLVYLLD